MPRDITLYEDMTKDDVAAINADDRVKIKMRHKHSHSTRQLFRILKSKQSELNALFHKVKDLTFRVDYWNLYDCRDKTLDDKRTREMMMHASELNVVVSNTDSSHERDHESVTCKSRLKRCELTELRTILQRFPYLHVEFSCTIVGAWDSKLIGAWIGVIRTFMNISDLDTTDADKYGHMVAEFLENIAYYWGVKPTNIIRLRGVDNNFDAGYYNSDAGFIAEADDGLFDGCGWKDLVDHFDYEETCGPFIRVMAFPKYDIQDSTACANDFEYAARYFPNLRKLSMNLSFDSCTTDTTTGVKVFEIPGMQQLRNLEMTLHKAGGVNPGDTLEIRVGPCPRLRKHYIYSNSMGINVRLVLM